MLPGFIAKIAYTLEKATTQAGGRFRVAAARSSASKLASRVSDSRSRTGNLNSELVTEPSESLDVQWPGRFRPYPPDEIGIPVRG
jgi:hypothetical protein